MPIAPANASPMILGVDSFFFLSSPLLLLSSAGGLLSCADGPPAGFDGAAGGTGGPTEGDGGEDDGATVVLNGLPSDLQHQSRQTESNGMRACMMLEGLEKHQKIR